MHDFEGHMRLEEIIEYVEDKDIISNHNWYLHATVDDLDRIRAILSGGIKCNYLLGQPDLGRNGPYYISLFKNSSESTELIGRFEESLKFIVSDIKPHRALVNSDFAETFSSTRIPIRSSHYYGEYQQYLRIDPSKFVGLDYSLALIMSRRTTPEKRQTIWFLRDITQSVCEIIPELPIYDLATHKEINKEKVLKLTI